MKDIITHKECIVYHENVFVQKFDENHVHSFFPNVYMCNGRMWPQVVALEQMEVLASMQAFNNYLKSS